MEKQYEIGSFDLTEGKRWIFLYFKKKIQAISYFNFLLCISYWI